MSAKVKNTESSKEDNLVKEDKFYGPDVYKRDEHGLLKNVSYIFNEDGSVNWRAMVKPEFLYPNKSWFEKNKKAIPDSIAGLADNQLLISLAGIKYLAKLRGFKSVDFSISMIDENYCSAKCEIEWIENYESPSSVYADCANASFFNTNEFFNKFLETIACNRAFVRCVRNFLNVFIVGVEEMDQSPELSTNSQTSLEVTPQGTLRKIFSEALGTDDFDSFKNELRQLWAEEKYRNPKAADWKQFKDIPAKDARELMDIFKSKKA